MARIEMRVWSDEEVSEMQNYIIERDPDLWKRMQEIEIKDGDYREREEDDQALRLIFERHPEIGLVWAGDMFSQLRTRLRRHLGIIQ